MSTDDDVTLGELGRLIKDLTHVVRDIPQNFLHVRLWEVEKRTFEDKHHALGREISDLRGTLRTMDSEKDGEHKELNGKIDRLKDQLTQREGELRKEKAQRIFAIGLAVLASVLGTISTIVVATLSAAINGGP